MDYTWCLKRIIEVIRKGDLQLVFEDNSSTTWDQILIEFIWGLAYTLNKNNLNNKLCIYIHIIVQIFYIIRLMCLWCSI